MNKFFRDVFLRESAIYTLWGTKPITRIIVRHISEEEVEREYLQLTEEEKKEVVLFPEAYDLPENLEKWEKIQSHIPMQRYLFFKKPHPRDQRFEQLFFVNIEETAQALQEHYEIFKKHLGRDFDPLEEACNLENNDSFYWDSNALLHGILFGYGLRNSSCFYWKWFADSEKNQKMDIFLDSLEYRFAEDLRKFTHYTFKHFMLPAFASFSPEGQDEVVEKYIQERKRIQQIYKGKDFVNLTLQKLMDSDTKKPTKVSEKVLTQHQQPSVLDKK